MTQLDDTKTRLDHSAIAMFARKGVAATSVRDIARGAQVADGTLYRHYSSKEAMARALFERHYSALAGRFLELASGASSVRAQLDAIVAGAYALFDSDPDLFSFLLLTQHDHLPAIGEEVPSPVEVMRDLLQAAMDRGDVRTGDAEEATALVFGLMLQPAFFTAYGRLEPPLASRAPRIAAACARAISLETANG